MRVSPGPPFPIEPGGTYARSPPPEPPISGIGYHWQLQKNTPFPDFVGKSSRDYGPKIYPPPPSLSLSKMGIRMRPLMHSSWGGGGGGWSEFSLLRHFAYVFFKARIDLWIVIPTDRATFPLPFLRNSLLCLLVLDLDIWNRLTDVIVDIRPDVGEAVVVSGLIIEVVLAVERRRPRQWDHVLAEDVRGDGRVIVVTLVDDIIWKVRFFIDLS